MNEQENRSALIEESGLKFSFDEGTAAIKFDDTKFYRKFFNMLPGGKGVDVIADNAEFLQLIEIKNCTGEEKANLWRTSTNNGMIHAAPKANSLGEYRESLDIEISKKVASTIACLYGAWSKDMQTDASSPLVPYWQQLTHNSIKTSKQIRVFLFLEGKFEAPRARSKKMIMSRLEHSIQQKLSWLNCKVSVVDSNTYSKKFFHVL